MSLHLIKSKDRFLKYISLLLIKTFPDVGTNKPIIKSIGVSDSLDMTMTSRFYSVVDKLLFDAKPKIPANLPGGNGEPFSWEILKNIQFPIPWILAGGLDSNNISDALKLLSPDCVDVSSGVEEHAGKKNFRKVSAFVDEVRSK